MLIFLVGVIAIALAIYWIYRSKQPKPSQLNRGERAVIQQYQQHFQQPYILLNNCTLPDIANGTTQIDHIILSPYGIFVLESKDYQGWIFGLEYDKHWRQSFGKKKTYTFQNPIRQNFKHIKVLQHLLADVVEPAHFYSVIVFTPRSQFKNPMPEYVCCGNQWVAYVKRFQHEVISPIKLKRIELHLKRHLLEDSQETDQLHRANLQRKRAERD